MASLRAFEAIGAGLLQELARGSTAVGRRWPCNENGVDCYMIARGMQARAHPRRYYLGRYD